MNRPFLPSTDGGSSPDASYVLSQLAWSGFSVLHYRRRQLVDRLVTLLTGLAVLTAVVPLFSILIYVGVRGLPALNLAFFTQMPKPIGEVGGGMLNAIVGSILLVGLAAIIGLPVGIMAAIYLSEYGRGRLADIIRLFTEVMSGLPSIVVGIFAYALVVRPLHHFSALAGGIALGVLMIPVVTRTTEEMIRMVPQSLREAGLALGLPKWRVIVSIVLPAAVNGIITGAMLSIARVAGETAPLLFTALNNAFFSISLLQPIASLPVQIYTYATTPYPELHRLAWGGAFVLVMMVLITNLLTRFLVRAGYQVDR
ncbi:MAG: phosphate ABC transporter permease PstA [Limnochordales bacterium]|nr:phosphate ABC transporter permease PstA [Limnochordales bacterium]